jgi:hypothetical protein
MERLFPPMSQLTRYKLELRKITQESNAVLFQVVDDLLDAFLKDQAHSWSADLLGRKRDAFLNRMLDARNAFVASNQDALMRALHPERAAELVTA